MRKRLPPLDPQAFREPYPSATRDICTAHLRCSSLRGRVALASSIAVRQQAEADTSAMAITSLKICNRVVAGAPGMFDPHWLPCLNCLVCDPFLSGFYGVNRQRFDHREHP